MKIICIETSTGKLSVGLMNDKGRILEYCLDSGSRHTELLLPTIKKALRQYRLTIQDIDYFAVGLGPGSFTGLRIGLATIKGFAAVFNKPVLGIGSLDIIARNALLSKSDIICPLIDARRNLIFTALYGVKKDRLKRIGPYLLVTIDELLNRLNPGFSITFLGNGISLYKDKIKKKIKKSVFLSEDKWYPRVDNLIDIACEMIKKRKLSDVTKLKPIYLYPKDCQVRNYKTDRGGLLNTAIPVKKLG